MWGIAVGKEGMETDQTQSILQRAHANWLSPCKHTNDCTISWEWQQQSKKLYGPWDQVQGSC